MSKHLESVATTVCMKTVLMFLNFVFWVLGMLMLCTGIWLRIQLQDYFDISVEGSGAALLILASFGAVLVLATTLACCCTTRGHPALLYLYGAFLAVVAILGLGAGASVYAYRSTLNEGFYQGLNDSMVVYGQDPVRSNHIDTMQSTLQCCGNKGYADWISVYGQKEIPLSCCKVPQNECDRSDTDQIYVEGCYTRVLNFINETTGLVAWTAKAVAVLVVGVFLACCLANNINKTKYEQVA